MKFKILQLLCLLTSITIEVTATTTCQDKLPVGSDFVFIAELAGNPTAPTIEECVKKCTEKRDNEGIELIAAMAGTMSWSGICVCFRTITSFHDDCLDYVACTTCTLEPPSTDPCLVNNGTCPSDSNCTNINGTASCICKPGYIWNGISCEADPCLVNNGACPSDTNCTNINGTALCICKPGYRWNGVNCEEVMATTTCQDALPVGDDYVFITELAGNPTAPTIEDCVKKCTEKRDNEGIELIAATAGTMSWSGVCMCFRTMTTFHDDCLDYVACTTCTLEPPSTDPCLVNNGACPSDSNCTNINGAASCICKPGYRWNGINCEDVNECDKNPCHKFASCKNARGSYHCNCHKGYMGDGFHCQEMWLPNSRCGPAYRLLNGMEAQCDHESITPCCSEHGFCGHSPQHCECPMCLDYRKGCVYNDMEVTVDTVRIVPGLSGWRECESLCIEEERCMSWVWTTQAFPDESFQKMCTLKREGDEEKLQMRFGSISGLKHCPYDQKREYKARTSRNELVTCSSSSGSCKSNICTRGATGSVLKIGHSLRSDNKMYIATMQHDGNFVVYCNGRGYNKPIWSTRTNGRWVVDGMMFQADGNLVLYTMRGKYKEAIWSSDSFYTEADHLVLQDDGNLVLYGFYEHRIYWESKSYGMC